MRFTAILIFLSVFVQAQSEFCHPPAVDSLADQLISQLTEEDRLTIVISTMESAVRNQLFMTCDRDMSNLDSFYNYLYSKDCYASSVDNVEEVLFQYTYYKMHGKDTCVSDLLKRKIEICASRKERAITYPDADSINGIYIPRNLKECYSEIDSFWSDSTKTVVKNWSEREFTGKVHHGFGMWIRNNWGLWGGSRLAIYFKEMGIWHPDDMSSIVLTSYHRYLNRKPIRLKKQISYYQAYWASMDESKPQIRAKTKDKKRYTSIEGALENADEVIDISITGYNSIPKKFKKFRNLEVLEVDSCPNLDLSKSMKLIKGFTHLQKLVFWSNGYSSYPQVIGELSNLKELLISDDNIKSFPNSIGNLQALQSFTVSNCPNVDFEILVEQIDELNHLTDLDLSNNELNELPINIIQLKHLKEIDLTDNNFSAFPEELKRMNSLEYICLFQNNISSLNFSPDNLLNLNSINLCYNSFDAFPIALANLKNLKKVIIWHCNIAEFPNGIEKLKDLEYLNLSGNPISKEQRLEIKGTLQNTQLHF